ncbi:MAG: hypothetical protein MUE83_00840 [Tabrizicola sp.]|jgi:hypothetical protein|nr:hypothetical protein [Tabrizicola sp.]
MSGPTVPYEWTRICASRHDAEVAKSVMKSPTATQIERDSATIAFARAADAIIEDLNTLSAQGVLGRITLFRSRRERK